MDTDTLTLKRIGYWISAKKSKKMSVTDIEDALRDRNITAVRIDLDRPLEEQGEFDGFLHKLTDIIAKAESGDEEGKKILSNLETYIEKHPHVVVVDPIPAVRTIINRYSTYSIIQDCDFETKETVFVPPFVTIESLQCDVTNLLRDANIQFPVVCKPIFGHGGTSAHEMTLIFNARGFTQCKLPCVAQSFVNHNGFLYKLFSIGEESHLVKRPSIINLFPSEDLEPVHFHSDEISKPDACSRLTIQGAVDLQTEVVPRPDVLKCIVKGLHKKLKLGLFGVDVVVEGDTGRYGIIDVNVFPGYDGVPDFPDRLASYIRKQLDANSKNQMQGHRDSYRHPQGSRWTVQSAI